MYVDRKFPSCAFSTGVQVYLGSLAAYGAEFRTLIAVLEKKRGGLEDSLASVSEFYFIL